MVSSRCMRQQSGEGWDQIEDIDDDEDDEGEDSEEDTSEEDMAERERKSHKAQEGQPIVIDVSVLCFSYLEE